MKLFMWLIHIFIRWPAEETSIELMCLWMETLSHEKLHLLIYFVLFLTTLRMCYPTIKDILGSCESLCLLLIFLIFLSSMWFTEWVTVHSFCPFPRGPKTEVKAMNSWHWSSRVVSFVVGSLCVVLRSSPVVWRSLWIVVGRCGSFRVLLTSVKPSGKTKTYIKELIPYFPVICSIPIPLSSILHFYGHVIFSGSHFWMKNVCIKLNSGPL